MTLLAEVLVSSNLQSTVMYVIEHYFREHGHAHARRHSSKVKNVNSVCSIHYSAVQSCRRVASIDRSNDD